MPTNASGLIGVFIVGRLLAEQAGLSPSQANQWAAVLMAVGLSPASILLVSELARRDAANQPTNTALASLQTGQAQILELNRQTHQTVAEIQHLSRQALAVAQAASQTAQRAVDLATTAGRCADHAPQSAEQAAMRAGTGAAGGRVAEVVVGDVPTDAWRARATAGAARRGVAAVAARLSALVRQARQRFQRRTGGF